ncbi:MAG: YdcF family protein [Clostridia bacterium]|nr:YdcF family protein [Clostridia bacterium]
METKSPSKTNQEPTRMQQILSGFRHFWTRRRCLTALLCVSVLLFAVLLSVFSLSFAMCRRAENAIVSAKMITELSNVDYIVVLGAGLRPDGSPSDMLADRLTVGIELLQKAPGAKLLLTGDDSGENYNEVKSMSAFAVAHGVAPDRIVTDGNGYSTYESIYRAQNVFGAKNIVVVTQEYHLYRAVYIAEKLGMHVKGVSADLKPYRMQFVRNMREHMARFKDFFFVLLEHKVA